MKKYHPFYETGYFEKTFLNTCFEKRVSKGNIHSPCFNI